MIRAATEKLALLRGGVAHAPFLRTRGIVSCVSYSHISHHIGAFCAYVHSLPAYRGRISLWPRVPHRRMAIRIRTPLGERVLPHRQNVHQQIGLIHTRGDVKCWSSRRLVPFPLQSLVTLSVTIRFSLSSFLVRFYVFLGRSVLLFTHLLSLLFWSLYP